MRKALNLYTVAAIPDFASYDLLIRACSNYTGDGREEELRCIQKIAERLKDEHVSMSQAEGFCIASKFTTIDTEFDLLKITDSHCLNIELKSQMPDAKEGSSGLDRIREQLIMHRYLLAHLDQPTQLFTAVTDTMEVYTLGENDILMPTSWKTLAEAIKNCDQPAVANPDALFKPAMYLVSPHNLPDRFLNREYSLTKDQRDKKRIIMDGISRGDRYFSITGAAGTGKSLILYDIARELAERGERVLLLHCGSELPEGLIKIDKQIDLLDIELPKFANDPSALGAYNFILIDEAQRIWKTTAEYPQEMTLDNILCYLEENEDSRCIFSFDKEQYLSSRENNRQIPSLIDNMVPKNCSARLNGNLRVNPALIDFIDALTDNINRFRPAPEQNTLEHVTLLYADSADDGMEQVKYFINRGYVYIYYTPYQSWQPLKFARISRKTNMHSPDGAPISVSVNFNSCKGSLVYAVHAAIGQEFDNVVMYLDHRFHINGNGCMYTDPQHGYEYNLVKQLYQGLTRAREHITLVVIGNRQLYKRLTEMLCPPKNKPQPAEDVSGSGTAK